VIGLKKKSPVDPKDRQGFLNECGDFNLSRRHPRENAYCYFDEVGPLVEEFRLDHAAYGTAHEGAQRAIGRADHAANHFARRGGFGQVFAGSVQR
jgi:hypothetical protein